MLALFSFRLNSSLLTRSLYKYYRPLQAYNPKIIRIVVSRGLVTPYVFGTRRAARHRHKVLCANGLGKINTQQPTVFVVP